MNTITKLIIIPHLPSGYTEEEVVYMLPGVIRLHYLHNRTIFDEDVAHGVFYYQDDKGASLLKQAYYEHMAQAMCVFLTASGIDEILPTLLTSNTTIEAEVVNHHELLIHLKIPI